MIDSRVTLDTENFTYLTTVSTLTVSSMITKHWLIKPSNWNRDAAARTGMTSPDNQSINYVLINTTLPGSTVISSWYREPNVVWRLSKVIQGSTILIFSTFWMKLINNWYELIHSPCIHLPTFHWTNLQNMETVVNIICEVSTTFQELWQ